MPRLSTVLIPTTSAAMDHIAFDVIGEKHKGDGYYGFSDGLHTIAQFLSDFAGQIEIQATLQIDPADADWVVIDTTIGYPGPVFGYAEAVLSGSQLGAVVPAIAADTYDFDITINGGALQTLSITTVGGEDYDAIAALMNTALAVGSVVFLDTSAFRVSSNTTGPTSIATVAAGTAGSSGGDLFAAINLAETITTSFPAGTPGSLGTVTENRTYNFVGNYVWIRAVVTDITYGTITKIQLNY